MGEMSVRSRPRKDLAASFHRLRRMVVDVKSARKSLAAHHSLVAELVSVSFYPSLKDSLPRNNLQLDDSQEGTPLPLSALPPQSPTNPPHQGCCLDPLQLNDTQYVAAVASANPVLCPSASSKNPRRSTFSSLRSLTSKISASLSSAAEDSNLLCKRPSPQETEACSVRGLKSGPGKRLSLPAFGASLFLVFLCFFLCTGKEIAIFVAMSAYTILWLIRRLRTIVRQACENRNSSCLDEDNLEDRRSNNLIRSSTIPPKNKSVHFGCQDSSVPIRSQSCPALQEAGCSKEPGPSLDHKRSRVTSRYSEGFPARIKLGMILALALCGLVSGQIAAVCMCSCCILVLRAAQGLPLRRGSASKKVS